MSSPELREHVLRLLDRHGWAGATVLDTARDIQPDRVYFLDRWGEPRSAFFYKSGFKVAVTVEDGWQADPHI